MRNVNVNVYEFDDLSKDVQENVIGRYRDRLADLLNEDLEDIMYRELNNYTDNLDFELAYSLNCCQGDGVSFTGSIEGKCHLCRRFGCGHPDGSQCGTALCFGDLGLSG